MPASSAARQPVAQRRFQRRKAGPHGVFLRYRDVGARLGPVAVDLHGEDAATARFDAVATGGSGGLLPDNGQVYRVETGWRRVGGEWKLVNASWRARL